MVEIAKSPTPPPAPTGNVGEFADVAVIPTDFLRGPWVTGYDPLIRTSTANPPRVGDNYIPGAVLACFGFGDSNTHNGFLRRNIGGDVPAEPPIPFHGGYTLDFDNNLHTFQGSVDLQLSATTTNTIQYRLRDRDTFEWIVSRSSNPGNALSIQGTAKRVLLIADSNLPGSRWITNFHTLSRVKNPGSPLRVGRDFSIDRYLASLNFDTHGRLNGTLLRNQDGTLPIGAPSAFGGYYRLARNQTYSVIEGTIGMNFAAGRQDTLYFIMRDIDTIEWVLTDSIDPDLSGKVARGTMRRVVPI